VKRSIEISGSETNRIEHIRNAAHHEIQPVGYGFGLREQEWGEASTTRYIRLTRTAVGTVVE